MPVEYNIKISLAREGSSTVGGLISVKTFAAAPTYPSIPSPSPQKDDPPYPIATCLALNNEL